MFRSARHHFLSMVSFLLGYLMPLDELPLPRYPPGFTKEDVEFSVLYKCVLEQGCKAMQILLRTIYSQPVMNTDSGKLTLRKYLTENCGKSKNDIKSRGKNKLYLKNGLFDCNLMEEDFDISFGYDMIKEICGVDGNRKLFSEDLWNEMEWLKIYRNKVAHIYGFMTGDLNSVLSDFCDKLKNIYELIAKDYSISCIKEIDDMVKMIENSKSYQIRQDDWESYIQDVEKFRRDNRAFMTINGWKEIFKRDSKGIIFLLDSYLESLNPCTFLVAERSKKLSVLDNYVIPNILKNKTSFDLRNMFTTFDDKCKQVPKVVLMKGKSNSGKTSLCKFLLHSWATNNKTVIRRTDFDLAFYVSIVNLKSDSLEKVFKHELLSKTTKLFEDKHIIPTLQDLNILFLIDGFELRNKQTNSIIEEIFSKFGVQSANSRIFITTTPDDTGALTQLTKDNYLSILSLELAGFEETQMRELSQKVFETFQLENIDENVCLFETHMKSFRIEPEYLKLPGNYILILLLWLEDNDALAGVKSLTSLYQSIFNLCQEKFNDYLKNTLNMSIERQNVVDIFHVLGKSFLSSLKQETNISSQEIFLGIQAILPMKENIQRIVSMLFNKEDDEAPFMVNKTQMQYLAASYKFSKVNESDVEELLQCYDTHNFSSIITFFVGIAHINDQFDPSLSSDTFTTIQNQLYISGMDFEFWWSLISECPSVDSCGYDADICNLVGNVLEKEWILDENNVVKAMNLLQFPSVNPTSIKIEIPLGTDPFSISGLLKAFEDINSMLKHQENKTSFKIEAHFYDHFNTNNLLYSDQFFLSITNLYPHAQLKSFTGHFGDDVKVYNKLGKCYKLESFNARVNSTESFNSLICKGLCYLKGLKSVHICLDMSTKCDPNNLLHLPPRKGKLSLTFPNVTSMEDLPWLEACVNKITNSIGCQELHGGTGFQIPNDHLQKMGIKELK